MRMMENTFRNVQKKLKIVSTLGAATKASPLLSTAASVLPIDVTLSSVSLAENKLQIRASSLTEESIAQFMVNLEAASGIGSVTLNQISSKSDSPFISFAVDVNLNE